MGGINFKQLDFKKLDLKKIASYLGKSDEELLAELRRMGVDISDVNQAINDDISKALIAYLSTSSATSDVSISSDAGPKDSPPLTLSTKKPLTLTLKSKSSAPKSKKPGQSEARLGGQGETIIKTRSRRRQIKRADLEKEETPEVQVESVTQDDADSKDMGIVSAETTARSDTSEAGADFSDTTLEDKTLEESGRQSEKTARK